MNEVLRSPGARAIGALVAVTLGLAACGEHTSANTHSPAAASSTTNVPGTTPGHYPVGYDVSWAQCGKPLPEEGAFAILQITGGIANVMSPEACFREQAEWADTLTGTANQPKREFYIWPANPGKVYQGKHIADWPTKGRNKFGTCTGSDGPACSYQYGLQRGRADMTYATKQLGTKQLGNVYIDVESGVGNDPGTWQTNGYHNVVAIEGFAAAIRESGNTPGLYSNKYQLSQVAGNADTSPLASLREWTTGAETVEDARRDCAQPFIKGAKVAVAQYIQAPPSAKGQSPIDYNYPCNG